MKPDDTLTNHLKNAEYYGCPVPPYPVSVPVEKWEVTSSGLNVRREPWVANNIIRSLPYLAKVIIIGEQNGWAEIGIGEWVSKDYLRKVQP